MTTYRIVTFGLPNELSITYRLPSDMAERLKSLDASCEFVNVRGQTRDGQMSTGIIRVSEIVYITMSEPYEA